LSDPASTNEQASLPADPVSDVLETVRLRGAVFFLWEPTWPYGIGVADGRKLGRLFTPGSDCVVSYHIVTQGPCWAAAHGEEPIRLETGDTLLLPRGKAYKIADTPQWPTAEDEAASLAFFEAMTGHSPPSVVTDDGPGPEKNSLICGFLGCNIGPFNPLLSTLPGILRVPAPAGDDPLSGLIDFALSESRESRGGERCLLLRLSEVMFVEVMRRYLRSARNDQVGWLAGLGDPLVGRALALLHGDPTAPWTVKHLAHRLGASRSALADRFSRVVGMPPMQYLAQWRIQLASMMLRESSDKVYTVANAVGYGSEEAFSRAFKRITGVSPATWRKTD
jgi:AraC-like DNA-binding protein